MVGGVLIAAATAIVACTSFDAGPGSPPASVPDDAGAAEDAGALEDAGAGDGGGGVSTKACGPFQCPSDAILCESFETWPIEASSGRLVQGTVSPVGECTGSAMAGTVPAASSENPRTARVVRPIDVARRELFLDLDVWAEPKGDFTKSGFGTIVAISAIEGTASRGFVGLSFGVGGLVTVIRSVGSDKNDPTPIPHATWVHVSLHVKFDETNGLVEVAFDGETVTSLVGVKTLAGSLDGFSLQIGALTDQDSTPELTVKVDNVVLR